MATDLYVQGIPPDTRSTELENYFRRWPIKSVTIPRTPAGTSKGFAFIRFVNREDAAAAVRLSNGAKFKGRTLKVAFRKPSTGVHRAPEGNVQVQQPAPSPHSTYDLPIGPAPPDGLVYLCDRRAVTNVSPATTVATGGGMSEHQLLQDRIVPILPAPLAVYVLSLIQHLNMLDDPERSSAAIRKDIERLARFFAFTFYNALSQERKIDKTLGRKLARVNTLLQASGGQAIGFANELCSRCAHQNSLIQRGAAWWIGTHRVLSKLNDFCNRALHVSAENFEKVLQAPLMTALLELGKLDWALITGHGKLNVSILNGPSSGYWNRGEGRVPTVAISMDPFVIYREQQNRLDCFQQRENRTKYCFTQLGEPSSNTDLHILTADSSLIKVIQQHCPVDAWRRESNQSKQFKQWETQNNQTIRDQGYDFADLLREASAQLYGREEELRTLKTTLFGQTVPDSGAVLLVGPQGVGKSALMWKLREHAVSLGYPLVWFCFRDDDRRCNADSFFAAAAIQIAKYKGSVPKAESPQARFEEMLAARATEVSSIGAVPVLMLDGLDALSLKHTSCLARLLAALESIAGAARWICSSQPLTEMQSFVLRNESKIVLHELGLLAPCATRQFLREELRANASQFTASDLDYLTSNQWLDRVMQKPDAGLPLYIRHVLDSAIARDYRDPDQIPPTLDEAWKGTVIRLKHDVLAIKLLALLSVALGSMATEEIADTLAWPVGAVEESLKRHPAFAPRENGWSIRYSAFRQYVRESNSIDLRSCRNEETRNLIRWASNWQNCLSRYPLEFLARHLEEEDPEKLKSLSLDDQFLAAQAKAFPNRPDLPLDTAYRALKVAVQDGEVTNVFRFALRHAEYVAHTITIAKLSNEFNGRNYRYLSNLASFLPEEQEQNIWKLVGLMGALVDHDRTCAEEIAASIRYLERGRGSQKKYELPAAILLALVVSMAARVNIDIEEALCDVADGVLGGIGKAAFFDSLGYVQHHDTLTLLYPATPGAPRDAVRALAKALGRERQLGEVSELLELSNLSATRDEIRFEAARGLSLDGDVDGAISMASHISSHDFRRAALCSVAADRVVLAAGDSVRALLAARQFWDASAISSETPHESSTDKEENITETIGPLISSLIGGASTVLRPLAVALVDAELGIIQGKALGDDSVLHHAELAARSAGVGARHAIIDAYVRLERWEDARRLVASMPLHIRSKLDAEISAAEMLARSGDVAESWVGQQPSIQRGCDLSSALSRGGHPAEAFRVLFRILPLLHSPKAEQPSLWGRPRLLGEVVGALYSLSEHSVAEEYFQIAYKSLLGLRGVGWEIDRAFAFLNLAEALVAGDSRPTGDLKVHVNDLLHEASREAMEGLGKAPRATSTLADILASVWELRKRHDIFCGPSSGPSDALSVARSAARPNFCVPALVEIARAQARLGLSSDARATLAEARSVSSKGGALERARVLLGQALCGQTDGLEDEIRDALSSLHGDARQIAYRAEVELCLRHSDMQVAEARLDKMGDVEVRSHAARDIALKYAELGDFTNALRVSQQWLGASRSELVPDVAAGIAALARTTVSLRGTARNVLLQFSLETARYLDGTYRVLGAIINSRAFELTAERLKIIADSLFLGARTCAAGER